MSLVFGGSPEVKKLCIVNQGGRGPGLKRPCSASDRGSLTRGMQMFQKGMGMPSWCAWNKVKICAFFDASPWLAIKKRKEWLNGWSVILLSSHFSFSYVRTIPSWWDLPRCFKSADQSSTQLLKSGFRICISTEDEHHLIRSIQALQFDEQCARCKFLEGNNFQWTSSMSDLDPEPS